MNLMRELEEYCRLRLKSLEDELTAMRQEMVWLKETVQRMVDDLNTVMTKLQDERLKQERKNR